MPLLDGYPQQSAAIATSSSERAIEYRASFHAAGTSLGRPRPEGGINTFGGAAILDAGASTDDSVGVAGSLGAAGISTRGTAPIGLGSTDAPGAADSVGPSELGTGGFELDAPKSELEIGGVLEPSDEKLVPGGSGCV